ncbi:hypothetical protein EV714DRAFT_287980 [Schizophyllum commune]
MYTPQADLSEDGKSLTAIIDELRVLCKCRKQNGALSSSELARTRKLWPRLRSLLIHGHPLRGLERTPPERTVQGPRLDLLSQPIQDAMDGLMTYANLYRTLCAIKVCPRSIFKALEPLEKKGWDWLEVLHPMHKNVTLSPRTHDYAYLCDVLLNFVYVLLGERDDDDLEGHKFIHRLLAFPNAMVYLVDFWVNLFKYVSSDIPDGAIVVRCTCEALYVICQALQSSDSPGIPPPVGDEVVRAVKNRRRRLCHTIARYARTIEDDALAVRMMFYLGSSLLAIPELVPRTCPRTAVSSIVRTLLSCCRSGAGADRAVLAGCHYLDELWLRTADLRVLEWSINDGIFTVLLHLASSPDIVDAQEVRELGDALRTLRMSFVHWRVLHAFSRKHDADLPGRRIAGGMHAGLVDVIDAYQARRKMLHPARILHAQRYEMPCANKSCTKELTRQTCGSCVCRQVYYCSRACQKRHWKEEHREVCNGTPLDARATHRDYDFIYMLAAAYIKEHATALLAEIARLDPAQRYHCGLYILFDTPKITHSTMLYKQWDGTFVRYVQVAARWADGDLRQGQVRAVSVVGVRDLEEIARTDNLDLRLIPSLEHMWPHQKARKASYSKT